jgi:hypothetical protein
MVMDLDQRIEALQSALAGHTSIDRQWLNDEFVHLRRTLTQDRLARWDLGKQAGIAEAEEARAAKAKTDGRAWGW